MDKSVIDDRREIVFLVLAGTFLCAMCLLNVIGITRFIDLGPLTLAVGVLPYPLTFLCTDVISELFGRKRANRLVWVGLYLNGLIFVILSVAKTFASTNPSRQPPWQTLELVNSMSLPNGSVLSGKVELFDIIYACTAGSVFASMVAYVSAQFCDVAVFHYLKRITKGKYLWLRNNGSTLVSQLIDSIMVIGITYGILLLDGKMAVGVFVGLVFSSYAFKATTALLDTIPAYLIIKYLSGYLQIDPLKDYRDDTAS